VRIALIGNFGTRPDEGMRKLCGQIETAVRLNHDVMVLQTSEFCMGHSWRALRSFRPLCLHYLTGPTIYSLLALKYHRSTLPSPVFTVATGLRPFLGATSRRLLPLVAPDFYLAQARHWESLFANAGCRTFDFPNGVDTKRFCPVNPARKLELKARWGLPLDKPIALHVGHVKMNRNLESLIAVQQSGRFQVLIVGSESESQTGPWHTRLENAGCRLHTQFVPTIEEVYQAADAYVFTVKAPAAGAFPKSYHEVGVIDLPLSIFEAMACGLPVVSTKHDALEYFIGGVPGLRFFDGTGPDCLVQLDSLSGRPSETRKTAERFDLARVMSQLAKFYAQIASNKGLD
jgi:glycosyltransferase involved in cell wall biosynthesis